MLKIPSISDVFGALDAIEASLDVRDRAIEFLKHCRQFFITRRASFAQFLHLVRGLGDWARDRSEQLIERRLELRFHFRLQRSFGRRPAHLRLRWLRRVFVSAASHRSAARQAAACSRVTPQFGAGGGCFRLSTCSNASWISIAEG